MRLMDMGIDKMSEHLRLVDERIKSTAPKEINGLERLLSVNGKRLRPSLVILIATHNGIVIDNKVIDAAAALELIHLSSLVHDDIMDGGTIRHGIPTINAQEGVDSAILAGDYLLARGFGLAAGVSAEAAKTIADTIADLCEGQAKELSDQFNLNRTEDSLLSAIRGKTSSLFKASCVMGAIVSDLDAKQVLALTDFADNFGIYYQLMDDVNDFVESKAISGKSVGNDIIEGNYTLPVIFSIQGKNKSALAELLKNKLIPTQKIREILISDNSINRTINEAEKYKTKALKELRKLDDEKMADALETFVRQFD